MVPGTGVRYPIPATPPSQPPPLLPPPPPAQQERCWRVYGTRGGSPWVDGRLIKPANRLSTKGGVLALRGRHSDLLTALDVGGGRLLRTALPSLRTQRSGREPLVRQPYIQRELTPRRSVGSINTGTVWPTA